jgi:tetratricopeptide (TPR) repeat protein
MWVVIIIIVIVLVVVFGKFFSDRSEQSAKIFKEGGMLVKYSKLIDSIKAGNPATRIHYVRADSVCLLAVNNMSSTKIVFTQTFGKLTIQWITDSPVFGKHQLEWDFDEYFDQSKILDKIVIDIDNYQQKYLSIYFPKISDENDVIKRIYPTQGANINGELNSSLSTSNLSIVDKPLKEPHTVNELLEISKLIHLEKSKIMFEESSKKMRKMSESFNFVSILTKGTPNEKIAYFKSKVDENDEDKASNYYYIGAAYSELKDYSKAIEYLNLALIENPFMAGVFSLLANCYDKIDKPETAIIYYLKEIECTPDDYGIYFHCALAFKKIGDMNNYKIFSDKCTKLMENSDFKNQK